MKRRLGGESSLAASKRDFGLFSLILNIKIKDDGKD
jgi:hypothetical protein